MGTKLTSKRTRARMAVAAIVLWVVGFEVMPWLHVVAHDQIGEHEHEQGTIVRVHFGHTHADGTTHDHAADHDRDHDTKRRRDDRDSRVADALAHGQHSLAHHGVAVPAPAPVVTSPLPVDRRPEIVASLAILDPADRAPFAAVARGPPAGSAR
jgi:hypothetical protein